MSVRKKLAERYDKRFKVKAMVDRYGEKPRYKGGRERTILLRDVRDFETEELLTDHLWLTVGKRIEECKLIPNDRISFDARVRCYMKGYKKDQYDYKLSYPSKFEIIEKGKIPYEEIKKETEEMEKLRKEMEKEAKNKPKRKITNEYEEETTRKKEKRQTSLTVFFEVGNND